MFFLHVCTSLEWTTIILLQPDIEVDDEEKTTTLEQAAAHEEFARSSKKRQQQRMIAWEKANLSSLLREGNGVLHSFLDVLFARISVCPYVLFSCVFLVFVCFSCCVCLQFSKAGTRGEENFQSRTGAIGMRKSDA